MRTGISITLSDANSRRLEGITADRNSAQKHVWRARIVLLSAVGLGTNAIMAAIGTAKATVWKGTGCGRPHQGNCRDDAQATAA